MAPCRIPNRVLAYQLSGGLPEKVALVRLAAQPQDKPLPPMDAVAAKAFVAYLASIREEAAFSPVLQARIDAGIARYGEAAH